MIDFSKAPEGATHVRKVLRSNYNYYKKDDCKLMCWSQISSQWVDSCNSEDELWIVNALTEIPKENKMLIECKTEREVMICEQALRMLRGEESEIFSDGTWINSHPKLINVRAKYQAKPKPKKELFVPWEWLPDYVDEISVDEDGNVWAMGYLTLIKLDLTDIDLPVAVKRPEGK